MQHTTTAPHIGASVASAQEAFGAATAAALPEVSSGAVPMHAPFGRLNATSQAGRTTL